MHYLCPTHTALIPEPTQIEVSTFFQIPSLHIIGLAGPEIVEAKERIRGALQAADLPMPKKRVVLNLTPAGTKKSGTHHDLALALALVGSQQESHSKQDALESCIAVGELGLGGEIRAVGSAARTLYLAKRHCVSRLILPKSDEPSYQQVWNRLEHPGDAPFRWAFCSTLIEAWNTVQNDDFILPEKTPVEQIHFNLNKKTDEPLLKIPEPILRVCTAALVGLHPGLLIGPQGTGKTQTFKTLSTLFCRLSQAPDHDTELPALIAELKNPFTPRHSETNALFPPVCWATPQTRAQALLGSVRGSRTIPGLFSHAHQGVLIGDELSEWSRDARESLRIPLETGEVLLNRAAAHECLPARFWFLGSSNLCPCGAYSTGEQTNKCRCSERERTRYLNKLSGPLLDRMDWRVGITAPLVSSVYSSSEIDLFCEQVERARAHLKTRFGLEPSASPNAGSLEALIQSHPAWEPRLQSLFERGELNLRSRHRITRLALSLSALDAAPEPGLHHFIEAKMLRVEVHGNAYQR